LEKSSNAAMGSVAAQQYVDALNQLIKDQQEAARKNPSRRTNAMIVYWFKERLLPTEDPFAWLYGAETEEQQNASALAQVRKLLEAIRNGDCPDLGSNHYYGLTISGASGRVMVRDWMEGQFPDLLGHIETWFADLSIVHREGSRLAPDPKFLAVGGALVRELKDLPASTTSVLWHAALVGLPIPQPIMAQALDRFRSALVQDETFNHARMGLIKAYFVRTSTQGESPMKPHLNSEHPDPAYHCGRLLAVLAKLQHAALGDVGAGVVQRYYPAASSAPGLTLGRLVSNARNHLGKLEGGLSFWYEQQIVEVMGQLGDVIPRTLDLEGQGLFALGYYQQLAALRAPKKKDTKDNNQSGDQQ
jgi:CRISPR-associated protein Csd1